MNNLYIWWTISAERFSILPQSVETVHQYILRVEPQSQMLPSKNPRWNPDLALLTASISQQLVSFGVLALRSKVLISHVTGTWVSPDTSFFSIQGNLHVLLSTCMHPFQHLICSAPLLHPPIVINSFQEWMVILSDRQPTQLGCKWQMHIEPCLLFKISSKCNSKIRRQESKHFNAWIFSCVPVL